MLMIFAETPYTAVLRFCSFYWDGCAGEPRSAWSRKHTCFCVASRWGGGTSLTGSSPGSRRGSGDHQLQGGGSHWANYYLIPEHSFSCHHFHHYRPQAQPELLQTVKQQHSSKGEGVYFTQTPSELLLLVLWSFMIRLVPGVLGSYCGICWPLLFGSCLQPVHTHTHTHLGTCLHTCTLEPVVQVTVVCSVLYLIESQEQSP